MSVFCPLRWSCWIWGSGQEKEKEEKRLQPWQFGSGWYEGESHCVLCDLTPGDALSTQICLPQAHYYEMCALDLDQVIPNMDTRRNIWSVFGWAFVRLWLLFVCNGAEWTFESLWSFQKDMPLWNVWNMLHSYLGFAVMLLFCLALMCFCVCFQNPSKPRLQPASGKKSQTFGATKVKPKIMWPKWFQYSLRFIWQFLLLYRQLSARLW